MENKTVATVEFYENGSVGVFGYGTTAMEISKGVWIVKVVEQKGTNPS